MKKVVVIVVLALLVGVAVYYVERDTAPERGESATASDVQPATDESSGRAAAAGASPRPDVGNATGSAPVVPTESAPTSAPTSSDSVTEPIPLATPLLSELVNNANATSKGPTILDYHHRVEAAPRDPLTSYRIEQEIRDVTGPRVASGAMRVERVECGTALCEVQLSQAAHAPGKTLTDALTEIQQLSATKGYKVALSSSVESIRDGTAAAILFLDVSK